MNIVSDLTQLLGYSVIIFNFCILADRYLKPDKFSCLTMPIPNGYKEDGTKCPSCLLPYNNKERTPKVRVTQEISMKSDKCYPLLSDPELLPHVLCELFGTIHV